MPTDERPLLTLEALRSVPLFSSLDDSAAAALRDLLDVREARAGARLFRAGDVGDAMFLIADGRVRIHVSDESGEDLTLAELGGGDFFGEMALLDGKPRSADATVGADARLAVLTREHFLDFVNSNPAVALRMLAAVAERLRRTDELLRQRATRNLNEEMDERLSYADRLADLFADLSGSWKFIVGLLAVLVVWVALNSPLVPDAYRFDRSPFELLGLLLGAVAGIQVPFILMSQNRQAEKDRLRADLDFRVNLKNELALAEVLRRLDVLESERLPLLAAEMKKSGR